jgi:hypothetical protein
MTAIPAPARSAPTRRRLLSAALLGAPALSAALFGSRKPGPGKALAAAPDAAFPEGAHVTVAGPEGGDLDSWSKILVPALADFMPANTPVRRSLAGGVDGVTGANQFTAQALPDGSAALLVPGMAVLAWLRGDPAVQYDVARWVPLLTGYRTAVIAGRVDAARLVAGQKLRIGVSGPNSPEWSAVLGLERLGLQPVPVAGLVDQAAAEAAFAQHAVDVLLLRGPAVAAGLATSGARPICVLGMPGDNAVLTRDPSLPDIPCLGELLGGMQADKLTAAWRATAVAAQLGFGLMLPQLAAADVVAHWRLAVEQAIATTEIQAMASAQATRIKPGLDPVTSIGADADAVTALRGWLAARQGH